MPLRAFGTLGQGRPGGRGEFLLVARRVFILRLRIKAADVNLFDGPFDQFFNVDQIADLVGADQGNGIALLAGATGTANPMDVIFRGVRQFVIDDVGQVVDIQATGGNVGGNQGVGFAGLEGVQCLDAVELALVAMDGVGPDAGPLQFAGQARTALLGPHEDDALADFAGLQEFDQQAALAPFRDRMNPVADGVGYLIAPGDLDQHGRGQHRVSELFDFFRKGGRKQQALPLLRQHV